MKIKWLDIPDQQFEEIIAALLRSMGFENVIVRTGGSDDGWDIDALLQQRTPDGRLQSETWRVECKRYKDNPPADKIRDHYIRMTKVSPIPDHVLFVTTGAFTNPSKRNLRGFAEQDRVRLTFWERKELTSHIEQSMADAQVRSLIAPYVELGFPIATIQKACSYQVTTEIERRVGRKYLPDLCRPRPIEEDIEKFIACNLQAEQMRELAEVLVNVKLAQVEPAEAWSSAVQSIAHAMSKQEGSLHINQILALCDGETANVVKQTIEGVLCLERNCFFIKDKAGSGKTNLLCRLANSLQHGLKLPMFFSSKIDLPESRSLEDVIIKALLGALEHERVEDKGIDVLPADGHQLFEAVILTLQKHGAELVIFLDGVNENRDLESLDQAVVNLLSRWNGLPIRFIITCRDIFWGFFSGDQWARFFYKGKIHDLPGFEDTQVDEIISAYFESFEIKGSLIGTGRDKCRHPLLLRFFCEAYRGQNIRVYEDLRLKDLFEVYWKRKREEIAAALQMGRDGGRRVEDFLFKLLAYMSDRYATQIPLGKIPELTGDQDLDSGRSLYKHLLDQDIILEEMPPDDAFDRSYSARRISFVYDEFYDYMMALQHVRSNDWDARSAKDICLDFVNLTRQSASFEQLHGVAEYLVLIAEQKDIHRPLCATLARLGNYEILCNVLPKLKHNVDWAGDVLRICLLSLPPALSVKNATGWQPPADRVENLIREAPEGKLLEVLNNRL